VDFDKNKVHLSFDMMLKCKTVLVCALFLATPLRGQEAPVFAPLHLADFGARDLLEARRDLMLRLSALPPGDVSPDATAAQAEALLDMSELHLAQMMRTEAAAYLAAVDPATLPPDAQRRRRTLDMALALLSDSADPGLAVSRSVGWTEGQALRAAAFSRMGSQEEAARLLPQAMEALPHLSPAMTASILPQLLETALVAGNWEIAETLAARFPDHAELREKPVYHFLLAHASEISGDVVTAFDGYARAASGRDAYAHRARLAILRLGRRTDTLSLPDAISLLKTARWAWSGDATAREGIELLADYALEAGDTETSLWALGKLRGMDADKQAAEAARVRARQVIEGFYAAGAAGEIDLGKFIAGHARIAEGWRFDPGFPRLAEPLPQTLFKAGMTAAAAREFRNLRLAAEATGDANGQRIDQALVERLRLSEARALLAGGQADKVVDLLLALPQGGQYDDDVERMLVQALSLTGRADELTALKIRARDIELMRGRAIALYETGTWTAAHEALLDLWEAYPAQFTFSDATRLTLAAYEVGDTATVARAAGAFPSLTDMPGWSEIAERLEHGGAGTEVMDSETMRLSMENAARVLDAVTQATEIR
jgi:hypothetical protein